MVLRVPHRSIVLWSPRRPLKYQFLPECMYVIYYSLCLIERGKMVFFELLDLDRRLFLLQTIELDFCGWCCMIGLGAILKSSGGCPEYWWLKLEVSGAIYSLRIQVMDEHFFTFFGWYKDWAEGDNNIMASIDQIVYHTAICNLHACKYHTAICMHAKSLCPHAIKSG